MMSFSSVFFITENDTCRVTVAKDASRSAAGYEALIEVFDHDAVRRLLSIYEQAEPMGELLRPEYVSSGGQHFFVFPYVKERPLASFFMGETLTLPQCEEICQNYITACMTSGLPWPVLYLVLTQKLVHLAEDRTVYLSYTVDLKGLDEGITEKECVVTAAEQILEILKVKEDRRADSFRLFSMKTRRRSYEHFIELYRDLKIAGLRDKRRGILSGVKYWFVDHKDGLFRWLLRISLVLLILTVITLLTNAIFGDVPWLRLFIRSFERIGTESLLQ